MWVLVLHTPIHCVSLGVSHTGTLCEHTSPAHMRHRTNVRLMLGHRLRRWPSIISTLVQLAHVGLKYIMWVLWSHTPSLECSASGGFRPLSWQTWWLINADGRRPVYDVYRRSLKCTRHNSEVHHRPPAGRPVLDVHHQLGRDKCVNITNLTPRVAISDNTSRQLNSKYRTSYDISQASVWSRWPSRPIRSLRYIVTCTRIWAQVQQQKLFIAKQFLFY